MAFGVVWRILKLAPKVAGGVQSMIGVRPSPLGVLRGLEIENGSVLYLDDA